MVVVIPVLIFSFLYQIAVSAEEVPARMELNVNGVTREALVYPPSQPSDNPVPLVFGFHGHGGSMKNAARSFVLHKQWPEAVTVYMQGIPTPGMTDPEGRRNGWQKFPGDQGDRDLLFFDEMLKTVKQKHKIDESRVYSTGHSNGGGFTYLLWAERHNVFAAMAPSAAGARNLTSLKPLPCLHIAGKADTVVPFRFQQLVMQTVRKVNGCTETGTEWAEKCILYGSENSSPFVSFIHDGDHKYPAAAPGLIVKFFKEHTRPLKKCLD